MRRPVIATYHLVGGAVQNFPFADRHVTQLDPDPLWRTGDCAEGAVTLVVEVGGLRLGLPAAQIDHVHRAALLTRLPDAPAVVAGLLNVAGRIVPVLSLRARLGLDPKPLQGTDRLVIARVSETTVALLVDSVVDLVSIPQEDLDASVAESRYLASVAVLPDGLLLIGDLDAFLSPAETEALDRALGEQALARG